MGQTRAALRPAGGTGWTALRVAAAVQRKGMGCVGTKGVGGGGGDSRGGGGGGVLDEGDARESLVWERREDVMSLYDVEAQVGTGSMGAVYIVARKSTANRSVRSAQGSRKGSPTAANTTRKEKEAHVSEAKAALERQESAGSAAGTTTRRRFAMKTIVVNRVDRDLMDELRNEIEILRKLHHPNIVQLNEVYYHKREVFLIMDLCTGGDLGSRDLTEVQTARAMVQVLRGLCYIHNMNITHRDLKLENIMFETEDEDSQVKLIDFGLSQVYTRGEKMKTACGTVYTLAPEVLSEGGYTQQADLWSVGVMTYVLLAKSFPFLKSDADLLDNAKRARLENATYSFGEQAWAPFTREARNFIGNLLRKRPVSRWTAEQALDYATSTWFPAAKAASESPAGKGPANSTGGPGSEATEETDGLSPLQNRQNRSASEHLGGSRKRVTSDIVRSLNRFAGYGEFKRKALLVAAFAMDKSQLMHLRDAFISLDTETDGTIEFSELRVALEAHGVSEEDCRNVFDSLDQDCSGRIHYLEFLAAVMESRGFIEEERLAEAFDRLDSDDSGHITHDNLRSLLGTQYDEATVDGMIQEVDLAGDGAISYDEFVTAMRPLVERHNSVQELVVDAKLPKHVAENFAADDAAGVILDVASPTPVGSRKKSAAHAAQDQVSSEAPTDVRDAALEQLVDAEVVEQGEAEEEEEEEEAQASS